MKLLRFFLVSLLSISNAFLPTKHDLALKVVKSTSGMLANADTVGHRIPVSYTHLRAHET